MKKIIIATDMWYPQINGPTRVTEEICNILKKNNFEVILIYPRRFFNLPAFFYPEFLIAFFPRRTIKKIIEEEKPDYIHIVTEGAIGFATRAVCLQKKINFTTAYHGNIPEYIEHYIKIRINFIVKIMYSYYRWFHNSASATMVSTESLKKELEKHGFKNIVVSPFGIDTKIFTRKAKHLVLANNAFNPPVFVYFGRVAKEKNIEEYLNCNLPGTKLVIGSGPIEKRLKKQYKNVIFLGQKTKEELADLLSICDVFVFPSRTETFGIVILEALASGIPVAAHNVMGPRDIITQGVDGFMDENIEHAALMCLNLSREKCRQKALKFSWEKAGKSFIKNLAIINNYEKT